MKSNRMLLICAILLLFGKTSYSQTTNYSEKVLYYYQSDNSFVGCGTIRVASVLFFVSDTLKANLKKNQYYIIVDCPEIFGDNYFKKGNKYKVSFDKNYKSMEGAFPKSLFKEYKKLENFYVLKTIDLY